MSSCVGCEGRTPTAPCPARMQVGYNWTNYYGRCYMNAELFKMVGSTGAVSSSYESRMFLQRNAEKIMAAQREQAIQNLAPCAPCMRPLNDEGTRAGSERYVVRCNNVTCTREEVNPSGIGDARIGMYN